MPGPILTGPWRGRGSPWNSVESEGDLNTMEPTLLWHMTFASMSLHQGSPLPLLRGPTSPGHLPLCPLAPHVPSGPPFPIHDAALQMSRGARADLPLNPYPWPSSPLSLPSICRSGAHLGARLVQTTACSAGTAAPPSEAHQRKTRQWRAVHPQAHRICQAFFQTLFL